MTEVEKEELRKYHLPTKRVAIVHACPNLDEIMSDYWEWHDGEWHHYNDWHMGEGKGNTTRGCESDHAWKCLLEAATMFGFEK